MRSFDWMYHHALERKGDKETLESLLPAPLTEKELGNLPDDRFLSAMSRRIFRAGLKHSMVDAKWPAFEEVFFGFHPEKLILMSDEALEATLLDRRIIRHWGKVKSIRANASMLLETSRLHNGFGVFLANWPSTDIIGLWSYLKKQGVQLGGQSAPYFLRMVGKDTFVLTKDVVAALKAQGIVQKLPTNKSDLAATQTAFNQWQNQSNRPLCHISKLLSFCVD